MGGGFDPQTDSALGVPLLLALLVSTCCLVYAISRLWTRTVFPCRCLLRMAACALVWNAITFMYSNWEPPTKRGFREAPMVKYCSQDHFACWIWGVPVAILDVGSTAGSTAWSVCLAHALLAQVLRWEPVRFRMYSVCAWGGSLVIALASLAWGLKTEGHKTVWDYNNYRGLLLGLPQVVGLVVDVGCCVVAGMELEGRGTNMNMRRVLHRWLLYILGTVCCWGLWSVDLCRQASGGKYNQTVTPFYHPCMCAPPAHAGVPWISVLSFKAELVLW
eukprot:TRINITY_DN3920_c0_g2_i5.p1 TRINITY_DN3920_c0_g2~~TRINITY_DN3920_c0_g2_i5.p1  ORF type:complete len:275 (+),score=38.48 TRINITY_DN3920_c0_g2_i5:43-867(+)